MLALCLSLTLGLGLLILGLNLPHIASAAEPKDAPGQESGPTIGLVSSAVACLAVGDDLPGQPSGVVRLDWQGQAEQARLILSVAGSEAAHTIKVNGQPAARVPVNPGGQPCAAEEYFYLDVAPDLLVQGDNLIEITNDAQADDSWTAAQVRLVVFGHLDAADSSQVGPAEVSIAATTYVLTFTNPYDATSQEFMAQIPDGYAPGNPVPLLIFVHGRSSSMVEGINAFGNATNARGWLLASPELHGSWTGVPQPDPPGIYAYASLESQYDVVGAMNYMLDHYNVITSQIYLVGYSMGGQIATVTIAKFPHVFAAVFDNKGPTNMAQWYDEQWEKTWMERECNIAGVLQDPTGNPFCYQRRSSVNFASNYIHIPISITHSVSDTLVPIHHSRDLRDAINHHDPDQLASVYEDTIVGPTCDDGGRYHCYEPNPPMAVLNFLEQYTLNNNPSHVNFTTDESKSYHWLNVVQTGGDHWSQVEVTYYPISSTVTAVISDTEPLTVAFNLGSTNLRSTSVTDKLTQPGMGLPAATYLINGGSNYRLENYTADYLTTTLTTTGQFSLTISAITVQILADPAMVLASQTATSTITAVVKDRLNNPAPDGAEIRFSTTGGTFPNGSPTYTTALTTGQVTTILTLEPDATLAEITAQVGSVTDLTSVDVIHPGVDLLITPNKSIIYKGDTVIYTYQLINTGDIALTNIMLVDDNGTPGNNGDDFIVCEYTTLPAGTTKSCSHSTTLTQTTINIAVVTGRDPLSNNVTHSSSATVAVISARAYLPIVIKNN
jgi:dienelactone hydrolase